MSVAKRTGGSGCAALLVALLLAAPAWGSEQAHTRVAVLNFTNRNPGDGWDWLEKGLADMLITDLSASSRLRVVERERMQLLFEELELHRKVAAGNTAAADHVHHRRQGLQSVLRRRRGRSDLHPRILDRLQGPRARLGAGAAGRVRRRAAPRLQRMDDQDGKAPHAGGRRPGKREDASARHAI